MAYENLGVRRADGPKPRVIAEEPEESVLQEPETEEPGGYSDEEPNPYSALADDDLERLLEGEDELSEDFWEEYTKRTDEAAAG